MSQQRPSAAPRGFFRGIGYAFRGVPYTFKHGSLLSIALVPLLVNIVLLTIVVATGLYFFDNLWDYVFRWEKPEGWAMAALWWTSFVLLRILLYGLGAVVSFFMVVALGSIIAAPFHDALSERTEITLGGAKVTTPFSLKNAAADILSALRDQLIIISIYVAGMLCITLLHLIPLAGSVLAAILSFIWTCWFFALEFTEPALARTNQRWRERWEYLAGHFRLAFGFGVGAWAMMFVPLTMPFLFVSATLMICDLSQKGTSNTPNTPNNKQTKASSS